MKKIRLIVAMAVLLVLPAVSAFSQKIQVVKKSELMQALALQHGYSESEINAALSGNMDGQASYVGKQVNRQSSVEAAARHEQEQQNNAAQLYEVHDTYAVGRVFGSYIFSSPELNFIPSCTIPTPTNYKLATGDEIVIDIWGSVYQNYTLTLSPEGSVSVPNLGPIYLSGKTISEAESLMRRRLSGIFSGMGGDSPDTFMSLTLGKIRSFSINVVGDAVNPGTYILPSLSTVFTALYQAGGPNELGSFRDIKLYRNGKEIVSLDLYDFIVNGDLSKNVRLDDNDLIVISPFHGRVRVEGSVKRPMVYDMKENETLEDLFRYCAGFSDIADVRQVLVLRSKGTFETTYTVRTEDFGSFVLEDGDRVNVARNVERNMNKVSITGAVWNPGTYAINDDNRKLSSLIAVAGGLRDDAYMERGYIERFDDSRLLTALNFSPADVVAGRMDIELKGDDVVRIYRTGDLEVTGFVYTHGALRKPGRLQYRRGITLYDAILQSGGYDRGASLSNIEVARRKISATSSDSLSIVYSFDLMENPEDAEFELEIEDRVYVRNVPNFRYHTGVKIDGEVLYPGEYVVEHSVVRLSEIIRRSGGLTRNAYPAGATVMRRSDSKDQLRAAQRERQMYMIEGEVDSLLLSQNGNTYNVAIDLEKAMANPGSLYDLILVNGDLITVPQVNNTVKISGGVYSPNTVVYNEKFTYRDYIKQAGGYMKGAKRSKVYVVNMNGTIETDRTAGIKPGSEIVVPYENPENRHRLTTAEIISLATGTSALASVVITLINLIKK